MEIDPVADFTSRVRRLGEAEPIAAGRMAFLRKNFDHIAVGDFMTQRDHLAVYFCADALMADFRVNGVSKVDGSGATGEFDDAPFWSEGVDFGGSEVNFERVQEFAGFLEFLRPLDELAHPDDALVVVTIDGLSVFVFPVGGNTFFRDAVHFLSADLHFKGLAAVNDRCVQRLIKIGARHGDVILEAARNRAPDVVNDAERGVATALRIGDDADGEKIVNLLESPALTDNFPVQRKETFSPGLEFRGNSIFDELRANRSLHL